MMFEVNKLLMILFLWCTGNFVLIIAITTLLYRNLMEKISCNNAILIMIMAKLAANSSTSISDELKTLDKYMDTQIDELKRTLNKEN